MTGVEDPYEDLTISKGAVAEPGTTLVNETGSWRVSRPIVQHERCTGCALCVTYCPDAAAKYVGDRRLGDDERRWDRRPVPQAARHDGDRKIAIDYDYCKGCGICEVECPVDAIKMVPEEG